MLGTPDILRRQTETRQLKVNRRRKTVRGGRNKPHTHTHDGGLNIQTQVNVSPSDHVDIKTTLGYFDDPRPLSLLKHFGSRSGNILLFLI